MDFDQALASLSFRLLQPGFPWPRWYDRWARQRPARRLWLERWNTRLPAEADVLRAIDEVPRLSTLATGWLVNAAVRSMPAGASYVNVGVWNGFTFFAGMAGNPDKPCAGIDDFSEPFNPVILFRRRFAERASPAHRFHEMDYEDYFASVHQGSIGVYYYDGEHTYHHQLRGLQRAEPFFIPGTLVFVDDTNWPAPRQATLDFIKHSSRSYDIVLDVRTAADKHPTFWNGLMILRCTR